jgi:hypothetical protein
MKAVIELSAITASEVPDATRAGVPKACIKIGITIKPPPIPKSGSAPGVRPRPAGSIPPSPPPPPTQNRDRESDADKSKKGSLGSRFRSLINKFK